MKTMFSHFGQWPASRGPRAPTVEATRFWRRLQRAMAGVGLRRFAMAGSADAACDEIDRRPVEGWPAPVVIAAAEAQLLAPDAGCPLDTILQRRPNSIAGFALALLAAQTLGRIHRAGFCHGRPVFAAIVFDGIQVTFAPGREDPAEFQSLSVAQARDILVFFVSAAGAFRGPGTSGRLERIWQAYLATEPTPELLRTLRRNYRVLRFATLPLRRLPRGWFGRDLAQALKILHGCRR
jgi:hypothetical protein